MSNYFKIIDENGNAKVVDADYKSVNNIVKDNNQGPDLWTYCDVEYKEYMFRIRSKRFEDKKKVEIFYKNSWILLAHEEEPNLSDLIIIFYNDLKIKGE